MKRLGAALSRSIALALAVWTAAPPGAAQTAPSKRQALESNLVLFEVRVGQVSVSDGFTAYQFGRQTFLPLGELSHLLTIAIRTQPDKGTASGFVLHEERPFALNVDKGIAVIGDKTEPFDKRLVRVLEDDIYVEADLVARWLPLDFLIDLSSLTLNVKPREPLPLQMRLERESAANKLGQGGGAEAPNYDRLESPHKMIDVPFVDQTFSVNMRRGTATSQSQASYSTFVTSDLLGLQSSIYLTGGNEGASRDSRITLGRSDPRANLLGPLQARSFALGSIAVPGVDLISNTNATGNGFGVSNMPLSRPSSFDRHTFQGDLPPGWDVELYFNDALVGFQQSRPDGKYVFADRPLVFGPNQFRLVFHGPQGQIRVERVNFLLEDSLAAPGQFYYTFAAHNDKDGGQRAMAQAEWGLTRNVSLNGALVRLPSATGDSTYQKLGVRSYWGPVILTGDYAAQQQGGHLVDLGLKSRIGLVSISANHTQLNDFTSDLFQASADPVRTRDRLRLDGVVPIDALRRIPLTLEVLRDRLQSGQLNTEINALTTSYLQGLTISNQLQWKQTGADKLFGGSLQLGRVYGGIGLRSQINYTLSPESRVSSFGLAADRALAQGYLLALDAVRLMDAPETRVTASLTKTVGQFGLSIGLGHSTSGENTLGAQLFIALGREPRKQQWMFSALPMANAGSVSARAFIDKNMNGIMDPGETPVKGVGFDINGAPHIVRTNDDGIAYMAQLPPYLDTDVGVSIGTLEDPQLMPVPKGLRIIPRPGHVTQIDFPLALTSEIDGTVYLESKGRKRGIGDVRMELVDGQGKVIGKATSASDGFYIVQAVPPGAYLLQVSPAQVRELNLTASAARPVKIGSDGKFVNGQDFVLASASETAQEGAPAAATGTGAATPAVPAGAAADVKAQAQAQREAILQAVRHWAQAWSAKDLGAYFASYANDFQAPSGLSRAQWRELRRQRIQGKSSIAVSVLDPQMTMGAASVTVKFRQVYQADKLRFEDRKVLELVNAQGAWQIRREYTEN